jgi:hypothetical protein
MESTIPTLPVVAFLYKLVIGEKWYVGSSRESIQSRMAKHYQQGIATPTRRLYKAVADGGGWLNVRVEILTTFAFTTKEDLWREENKHINTADPNCLNSFRAILTEDERKEQRKEVSSRCKKALYAQRRQDPEWVAKERERQKALYARRKDDPEWLEKKRAVALASYHRRRAEKIVADDRQTR